MSIDYGVSSINARRRLLGVNMYGYGRGRKPRKKMSSTRRAYLAGVRAGKRSVYKKKRTYRKKRWY